jgi:eukaryotic-like serine/threonine-protein kinase
MERQYDRTLDQEHLHDLLKVPDTEVLTQLERILASSPFVRSKRLSRFLRFAVEQTLQGHAEELKEYLIGTEVFERTSTFDPRVDTIVRTQAHRLRVMLATYYETDGREDPVTIELHKGSYVPSFRVAEPSRRLDPPAPAAELPEAESDSAPTADSKPSSQRWVAYLALGSTIAAIGLCILLIYQWLHRDLGGGAGSAGVDSAAHLGLPLFTAGGLDVDRGSPVLSPKARFVVFPLIEPSGERRLWLRPLESMSAMPLAGSSGGFLPFWAPDESQIGFFAGGQLKVFRLSDGSVRALCEAPLGRGGTWAADGTILFSPQTSGAHILRISQEGGVPAQVTSLDEASAENDQRWPEFLPDGRHFVYSSRSRTPAKGGLYLADREAGPQQKPVFLSPIQSQVKFAATPRGDFLIYVKDNSIRARRWNTSSKSLEGNEVTLVESVLYTPASGAAFSVAGGRMLAYHNAHRLKSHPVQRDRSGKVLREILPEGSYESITVDTPARRLAVEMMPEKGESDIWISELGRPSLLRLSFDGGGHGVWSRDGRSMYFANPVESLITVYVKRLEDQARPQVVWKSSHTVFPTDVSPDGKWLCVHEDNPKTLMDLLLVAVDSPGQQPVAVRRTRFNERHGFFSPDGRFLAYVSDESGQAEVYVDSLSELGKGQGRRWKVSAGGGNHPRWNPNGKEIFYVSPDRKLMSVPVSVSANGLEVSGEPRRLFDLHATTTRGDFKSPYSVAPDGQTFYILEAKADSQPIQVLLLASWANGIK